MNRLKQLTDTDQNLINRMMFTEKNYFRENKKYKKEDCQVRVHNFMKNFEECDPKLLLAVGTILFAKYLRDEYLVNKGE